MDMSYNGQHSGRGGYKGRGQGRRAGRGCGKIICYNYGQLGHSVRDCQNPTTHVSIVNILTM